MDQFPHSRVQIQSDSWLARCKSHYLYFSLPVQTQHPTVTLLSRHLVLPPPSWNEPPHLRLLKCVFSSKPARQLPSVKLFTIICPHLTMGGECLSSDYSNCTSYPYSSQDRSPKLLWGNWVTLSLLATPETDSSVEQQRRQLPVVSESAVTGVPVSDSLRQSPRGDYLKCRLLDFSSDTLYQYGENVRNLFLISLYCCAHRSLKSQFSSHLNIIFKKYRFLTV